MLTFRQIKQKNSYFLLLTSYSSRRGFTLLEVLMVLGIILVVGATVFYYVTASLPRSQAARVLNDYQQTKAAFRIWMADTDNFTFPAQSVYGTGPYGSCDSNPPAEPALSQTDLFANVSSRTGWSGSYLSKVPRTPWGKEYLYDHDNDIYPDDGTHSGVNFRLVWCNDQEERQHREMLKRLDEKLDNNDGQSTGILRWTTGDQGKADILLHYRKNAL